MVRAEFLDHLRNIVRALQTKGVLRPDMHFSWDNAHNNGTSAELQAAGFSTHDRMELPPYSPDLHRVVEHAIGSIKAAMDATMLTMARSGWPDQPPLAFQAALRNACNTITPAGIRKDADGLPLAWRVVAGAEGQKVADTSGREWECTAGDWLPKQLR